MVKNLSLGICAVLESKWSELRQLFIDLGTGSQVKIKSVLRAQKSTCKSDGCALIVLGSYIGALFHETL